ncbi:MAG: HEAT repeat domain-containing protein, partial [Planctomycetota bacterium]
MRDLKGIGLLTLGLALWLPLASTGFCGEDPGGKGDVDRWIKDLADPGPTGKTAVEKLKSLDNPDPKILEKVSGEFEKDLARKWRARAVLTYWKTEGTPYEKEMHFLITQGAWELPKDAPAFLKAEREEAKTRLESETAEIIPVLLSTYPKDDYRRYSLARDLLVKRGNKVIQETAKLLSHEKFLPRLRAVHLLALIGGEEAMATLSKAAGDENAYVRKRVLEAWGKAGSEWSSRGTAFLKDADAGIRVAAVRAFEENPGPELARIGESLTDDSFLVRKAASEVLAWTGSAGFELILEAVAKGGAAPGKREAIRALGLVASPDPKNLARNLADRVAWGRRASDAVTLLKRLLGDGDWSIRGAAAEGLGLADHRDGLRPLLVKEKHPFVRFRLAEALGEGDRAFPPDPARFRDKLEKPGTSGLDALKWLPGDETALDDALKALRLTRKDLEFDRNITQDDYRFPVVQKALDTPLSLADTTRETATKIRDRVSKDPAGLLDLLPHLTGSTPAPSKKLPESPDFTVVRKALAESGLPASIVLPLDAFLTDTAWASSLDAALGGLGSKERMKILSHVAELGWDPELLPLWRKVDAGALHQAAARFAKNAGILAEALSKIPDPPDKPGVLWQQDTPLGKIILAGRGPDRFSEPAFLVIDLGGKDVYSDRAAGALGTEKDNAFSAVIDLGGNDTYVSESPVAQGAGFLGVGVLIDLGGNDVYRAVV